MAYLRIANLKKSYRVSRSETQEVLRGINVEFKRGEMVAVLGESGCGKSTFLNILGGLDNDYTGSVVLDGEFFKDYSEKQLDDYRKSKVGLIFQNYNLVSHMTVKQNVEVALTMNNINKQTRKVQVEDALKQVGLQDSMEKLPNQLSGGQRQRVAIARALVNDPEIILADEPTGALDKESANQVMTILSNIAKSGKLVILVTHSSKVASLCSRILTIDDGVIASDVENWKIDTKTPKPRKGKPQNIKFKDIIKLAFSNIMQTKKRSILVSVGMSIGIIAVILISCISSGITKYVNNEIADGSNALQIQVNSIMSISSAEQTELSNIDGVDYIVAGTYLKQNSLFTHGSNNGYVYMLQSSYATLDECLLNGTNCQDNEIVINETFAKTLYSGSDYLENVIGYTLDITYSGYTHKFTVSGVYGDTSSNSGERCAYITNNSFSTLFNGAGKTLYINTVYVYVKDTSYISAVKDTVEALGYTAFRSDSTVETLLSYIDIGSKVLTGFSAISLIVSAIMIFIVTYISIIERTKEIGILRAVGCRKKDVTLLFMTESAIIGLCAGLIAIVFTLFISIVANLIMQSYLSSTIVAYKVVYYIIGIALSILLSIGAGLLPSLEASKLDPIEALRNE